MSLNAVPSFANSSRPRTGHPLGRAGRARSRGPRPRARAASRTIERPSRNATSATRMAAPSRPSRSRLRARVGGVDRRLRVSTANDAPEHRRAAARRACGSGRRRPGSLRLARRDASVPESGGDDATIVRRASITSGSADASPARPRSDVDERRVERNGRDDGARSRPVRVKTSTCATRGAVAGMRPTWKRRPGRRRRRCRCVAQHAPQVRRSWFCSASWKLRCARASRRPLRGVDALLVAGERGAEAGLELGVDPARLALAGTEVNPQCGGGHRQQREQQEVDASLTLKLPSCLRLTSLRRYLVRVMLVRPGVGTMSGIERLVAAILLAVAVAGAAAFPRLLGRIERVPTPVFGSHPPPAASSRRLRSPRRRPPPSPLHRLRPSRARRCVLRPTAAPARPAPKPRRESRAAARPAGAGGAAHPAPAPAPVVAPPAPAPVATPAPAPVAVTAPAPVVQASGRPGRRPAAGDGHPARPHACAAAVQDPFPGGPRRISRSSSRSSACSSTVTPPAPGEEPEPVVTPTARRHPGPDRADAAGHRRPTTAPDLQR